MLENFITINFVPGARGHQIGRLLASCDDVLWYNHFKNGREPWLPGDGSAMTEISKYHFDRRFRGASGIGVDEFTVAPVLDIARRNSYPDLPLEEIKKWNDRVYPSKLIYPLHTELDECKRFFSGSKHLIVLTEDIDSLVDRFIKTTANFIYSSPNPENNPLGIHRKREKITFKQYWERNFKQDSSYEVWVRNYAEKLLNNFSANISDDDVVINSVDDLLQEDFFKSVCEKLSLRFNQTRYQKVVEFVKNDSYTPDVFTRELNSEDLPQIENFCLESLNRGFNNNRDLKSMKYYWCLENGGAWFGTFRDDKLISLSGIHPFLDGWRAMFRGAQFEGRRIGLNRYQMTSYSLHSQLPLEVEYAERKSGREVPIYVTTNVNHDASGNANRVHKLFVELGKLGVFDHCGDQEIYHTLQSIWKLNREKYYDVRS